MDIAFLLCGRLRDKQITAGSEGRCSKNASLTVVDRNLLHLERFTPCKEETRVVNLIIIASAERRLFLWQLYVRSKLNALSPLNDKHMN